MSQPQQQPQSDEEALREKAMTDVSDVLLNLEHTIARARKASRRMGDSAEERNVKLAIADALTSLETARKRLQRDTYFGGDTLRFF